MTSDGQGRGSGEGDARPGSDDGFEGKGGSSLVPAIGCGHGQGNGIGADVRAAWERAVAA